jgi:hypothetical protein
MRCSQERQVVVALSDQMFDAFVRVFIWQFQYIYIDLNAGVSTCLCLFAQRERETVGGDQKKRREDCACVCDEI